MSDWILRINVLLQLEAGLTCCRCGILGVVIFLPLSRNCRSASRRINSASTRSCSSVSFAHFTRVSKRLFKRKYKSCMFLQLLRIQLSIRSLHTHYNSSLHCSIFAYYLKRFGRFVFLVFALFALGHAQKHLRLGCSLETSAERLNISFKTANEHTQQCHTRRSWLEHLAR